MDWAAAIGNGAAGSVRIVTGGARSRICVAAPPVSMEERGSVVVGLWDASRHLLSGVDLPDESESAYAILWGKCVSFGGAIFLPESDCSF